MRKISRFFTWSLISGLGKPKLYQNLDCFTMCGDFGCGFDSRVGIHIEDILGNQIKWYKVKVKT